MPVTTTQPPYEIKGTAKEEHKKEMARRKFRRANAVPTRSFKSRGKYIPAGVRKNVGKGFSLGKKV